MNYNQTRDMFARFDVVPIQAVAPSSGKDMRVPHPPPHPPPLEREIEWTSKTRLPLRRKEPDVDLSKHEKRMIEQHRGRQRNIGNTCRVVVPEAPGTPTRSPSPDPDGDSGTKEFDRGRHLKEEG